MDSEAALVLSLIADRDLSAAVDRAAAAVGVRLVRTDTPTRTSWRAAAAVILDESAAGRCAAGGMPRRDRILLVTSGEPAPSSWSAAMNVGAQQLCTLPSGEADLLRHLSEAAEVRIAATRRGPVLAVTAGRGGAGASVFAAALALAADTALLVDLDPGGGGIDLLLGGEGTPGLRWPEIGAGGGRLAWAALDDALPRHRGIRVLSATRTYHEIDAGSVAAVVDAGRRGGATVVCDVPRTLTAAAVCALETADLVVVLTTCDVRGIAAAAATAGAVRAVNPNLGLVVRGPSPGGLRAREAADVASIPLLAAMRPEPMLAQHLERGGLRLRRHSPLATAVHGVLGVLAPTGRRAA